VSSLPGELPNVYCVTKLYGRVQEEEKDDRALQKEAR